MFTRFILLTLLTCALSQTEKIERVLREQTDLLRAKIVRLRNLKELTENNWLFRNWEGKCPQYLSHKLVQCSLVTNRCICWSIAEVKVNWFTATAFCDYHGMHLISFSSANIQNVINVSLAPEHKTNWKNVANFWTSGQDMITKRVWLFRSGGLLSNNDAYKSSSLSGLEDVDIHKLVMNSSQNHTSCISARLVSEGDLKFTPDDCLALKPFICQQFLE